MKQNLNDCSLCTICELIAMNSSNTLKIRNNILGQDQKVCGTFRDFSGLFHDFRSKRRKVVLFEAEEG